MPSSFAMTSSKFEMLYWEAGLEADQLYQSHDTAVCRATASAFQAFVHRGDWADPIYHRGEAAFDRGDLSTAMHAWSMAAVAGMEEAQDNMAQIFDQFTSWAHKPEKRSTDALALTYWAQSALQGSTLARSKICDYILFGLVPGSHAQAARCYRSQVDGSSDLTNKWRLARLYEDGADGFERDFPLAKRLYDVILMHHDMLKLTVSLVLFRLHVKAFWAMLSGDITAQRLFTSYLPTFSLIPTVHFSADQILDMVLFLVGAGGLVALLLMRRHMQGRMAEADQAFQRARALH